jgi:hypothetical protein
MAADLVYACFSHVPLWFPYPAYVTPFFLGTAQQPGATNLRDWAPEWEPYHPLLGSSAGTFALKNYVRAQCPDAKRIGICQYRKFITANQIGTPATNYQVMDVLSLAQVQAFDLDPLMQPGPDDFLIGRPGQFGLNTSQKIDYLYQYKDVHHIEDFLRFTAAAVEVGALDKNEVSHFFNEHVFFPGGIELGFFPADFWLSRVEAMERVVRHCINHHPVQRDGAQARVWAFCMERLGSYYLLKHLRTDYANRRWFEDFIGHLNLVTETETTEYTPGV